MLLRKSTIVTHYLIHVCLSNFTLVTPNYISSSVPSVVNIAHISACMLHRCIILQSSIGIVMHQETSVG